MKKLFPVLLIFVTIYFKAQTQKLKYTSGDIYLVAQDAKTKKIIMERPYGKILSIEYDLFYKSYNILFEIPEGVTSFSVRYLKTMDTDALLMQDISKPEDFYYVSDRIKENGVLLLLNKNKIEGHYMSYKITNIF